MAKFDGHFKIRHNLIFERAKFNKRVQLVGESAEQYITALYQLTENCDYSKLKSEMIRDRLVVGIRDDNLSQQLQMDAELTLVKAKTRIRQKETIYHQQGILKGNTDTHVANDLEEIKQTKSKRPSGTKSHKNDSIPGTSRKCMRCGKPKHPRDKCPARDAECFKCHKKGHYSSLCLSKRPITSVSTVQTTEPTKISETDSDENFLGTVESQQETQWTTLLKVNDVEVKFKIDTGAEVSAINEATFKHLNDVQLKKPTRLLYGPAMAPLTILGQFTANLTFKHITCKQTVFVVKDLKNNLLGLPAITSFNLISRMNSIHCNADEIKKLYPHLFQGLGSLGEEYEIKLKEDSKSFSLHTARNVPLPLCSKVQKELRRMESLGVISPVSEPSPWCSGMVVVPKPSGQVRICVDLKRLNECVQREFHPLPHVEETLAQLTGAQVFTKLDANSGFLVFGKNQAEHDTHLEAVLKRMESAGVTLNPNKCEFSQSELKFLGHIINNQGVKVDPAKTKAILDMQPPNSVSEMRRFIGMANQLSKFIPCSAELMKPLTELLSSKCSFQWGPSQTEAFARIKEKLTTPSILAWYDPTADTKVSADASSFGLGAVILQRTESNSPWKPLLLAR